MGIFEMCLFMLGIGFAIATPVVAFIIFVYIYSIPFFIYASFKLKYDGTSYDKLVHCGVFKTFFRTTRFYFQLLCFKKPTLM